MGHTTWFMLAFAVAVLSACSPPCEENPQQLSGELAPAFKPYAAGGRTIHYAEAGHFVLWKQPELIKSEILHLYENRLPEDHCRSSG